MFSLFLKEWNFGNRKYYTLNEYFSIFNSLARNVITFIHRQYKFLYYKEIWITRAREKWRINLSCQHFVWYRMHALRALKLYTACIISVNWTRSLMLSVTFIHNKYSLLISNWKFQFDGKGKRKNKRKKCCCYVGSTRSLIRLCQFPFLITLWREEFHVIRPTLYVRQWQWRYGPGNALRVVLPALPVWASISGSTYFAVALQIWQIAPPYLSLSLSFPITWRNYYRRRINPLNITRSARILESLYFFFII